MSMLSIIQFIGKKSSNETSSKLKSCCNAGVLGILDSPAPTVDVPSLVGLGAGILSSIVFSHRPGFRQ